MRPIVFNLKPNGIVGWLMLVLLAIPLVVLSFFFVAAAAVVAAIALTIAFVRIRWFKPKGRATRRATQDGDIIDVDAVEVPASDRSFPLDLRSTSESD